MKNAITINKYLLVFLIAAALVAGTYAGFYYTNQHYLGKEEMTLSQETETDQKNLICEARVQRGKTGEVISDYFIFERSAQQEDCERYIDYKNIPDDTETFWMGF